MNEAGEGEREGREQGRGVGVFTEREGRCRKREEGRVREGRREGGERREVGRERRERGGDDDTMPSNATCENAV